MIRICIFQINQSERAVFSEMEGFSSDPRTSLEITNQESPYAIFVRDQVLNDFEEVFCD
jgi:hypothetical protein